MDKDEVPCPGHSNECKFCKSNVGFPRYISGMQEVRRNADGSSSPIIDFCCRPCKENQTYANVHYDPITADRFNVKVPKGDEI